MIALPSTIIFAAHHQELQYDPDLHRYALRGGEVLPSVTTILKAEGIQNYGPMNSGSDFKMQVGTWVHQAIEWYEKGTLDESTLAEGIAKYLESYKAFKKMTGFQPITELIEIPFWHSAWRYCGTPDLPGRIGDRFVVVDAKTGQKRAGDCVQIAAYAELIINSVLGFELSYPEGQVVYLEEDGSRPHIEQVKAVDMHANKSVFLAALQLRRWKAAHNQA